MRIFLWHGYLLSGTGSNEYTAALARTLQAQGHEVTVFSQDPDAAATDLGGARIIRPALPGRLPVFVLDRYADSEPVLLRDTSTAERDAYVAANAQAIRDAGPADLLIANHLLLGAPVAAATGLPFVVKAHGSELEYAMRGDDELCRWARDSLTGALGVIAGSQHIERVVLDLVDVDPRLVHVIPPGVDTTVMKPQPRDEALSALLAECAADPPSAGNERMPDPGNAARLARFFADLTGPAVVYVGKISEEKGVPLLVDVVDRLSLPAIIVGFGPARAALEPVASDRVLFTGPLQHRHLRHLWPLMSASVAPSVFPEAFGMVAAEAAACGCPPVVADHSGLAEIAAGIRSYAPDRFADLVSFPTGDEAALADRLARLTDLSVVDHAELGAAARTAVVELWSWGSVAERITALVD